MLYIIDIESTNGSTTYVYKLFETHTESTMTALKSDIIKLVNKYGFKAKNFKIDKNQIIMNTWPHTIQPESSNEIKNSPMYIYIGKPNGQKYKLITPYGASIYINEELLKKFIETANVSNCNYAKINGKNEHKSVDTYGLKADQGFKDYIMKRHSEFRAKSIINGMDIDFEYIFEGKEVKISEYTGKSKRVVIPSFVTTICTKAFRYCGIQELKLNRGLKYIGDQAFIKNKIKSVEIPDTVEFMWNQSFDFDMETVGIERIYQKTNKNTLVIGG